MFRTLFRCPWQPPSRALIRMLDRAPGRAACRSESAAPRGGERLSRLGSLKTFGHRSLLPAALVALASSPAWAGIAWHADLDAAHTASASSGKPVLVVFQASWSNADEATADPLTSSEVEAVISACFEAVRLDVDNHADEARGFGIERVPAACVLDADRQPLVSFDCPDEPAELVAAAARAAQVAAAASPDKPATAAANTEGSEAFGLGPRPRVSSTKVAVSNKVRQLSSFADGAPSQPATIARYATASASGYTAAPEATPKPAASAATATAAPEATAHAANSANPYAAPPQAPALSSSPPAWPAEPPTQPSLTSFQPQPEPGPKPAIEPQPTAATPWLAATEAESAATAPADTGTEPEAAAETPEEKPASSAAASFWAAIQKPWSIFSRSSADPALAPPPPPTKMPPSLPQWRAALVKAPATEADAHGPMPLGLEGYCPVTVVERGNWVEGRPQWGARHRGRTYLFAGPEQQKAFLADPDRYAPALSGDDPVLAFENGKSEPGRRAFGVSYQSRMYLFSSPETRAAFTAEPDRYTSRVLIAEGLAPADGIRRF
jgi:YHS domain-containing protein